MQCSAYSADFESTADEASSVHSSGGSSRYDWPELLPVDDDMSSDSRPRAARPLDGWATDGQTAAPASSLPDEIEMMQAVERARETLQSLAAETDQVDQQRPARWVGSSAAVVSASSSELRLIQGVAEYQAFLQAVENKLGRACAAAAAAGQGEHQLHQEEEDDKDAVTPLGFRLGHEPPLEVEDVESEEGEGESLGWGHCAMVPGSAAGSEHYSSDFESQVGEMSGTEEDAVSSDDDLVELPLPGPLLAASSPTDGEENVVLTSPRGHATAAGGQLLSLHDVLESVHAENAALLPAAPADALTAAPELGPPPAGQRRRQKLSPPPRKQGNGSVRFFRDSPRQLPPGAAAAAAASCPTEPEDDGAPSEVSTELEGWEGGSNTAFAADAAAVQELAAAGHIRGLCTDHWAQQDDPPPAPPRPATSHGRSRTVNGYAPPMIAEDERDAELEAVARYERACGPILADSLEAASAAAADFAPSALGHSPARPQHAAADLEAYIAREEREEEEEEEEEEEQQQQEQQQQQ